MPSSSRWPLADRSPSGYPTSPDRTIEEASARLDAWIERQGFKGWDPYDALNSPLLKRLTFGNRRLGQVWVQLLKHSPVNLRPLLGVPKGYNPKGVGLFLASYWRKYLLTGLQVHLERTRFFADWLEAHVSPGYSGACWGYNFDWPNRGFFAPAGAPTIVSTAFIGLAFLDFVEYAGATELSGCSKERAFGVARSACEFILRDVNRLCAGPDEICFSYTPLDRRYVHNANLLGAWLIAEVADRTHERGLAAAALAAARYTVRRQRPDGSWLYGPDPVDAWIDNFHTGFVLVALKRLGDALGSDEFVPAVDRGYRFWKTNFFLPDGAPKYYPDRAYPIDIHSVAQAVLTYLAFSGFDPNARALALRTAEWGIRHMQAPTGCFHFQVHRYHRNEVPYMRWSQAWMQRALTEIEWDRNCEDLG